MMLYAYSFVLLYVLIKNPDNQPLKQPLETMIKNKYI